MGAPIWGGVIVGVLVNVLMVNTQQEARIPVRNVQMVRFQATNRGRNRAGTATLVKREKMVRNA